ncbi:Neuronal acetylcholine receptor subunit beta-3 [Holothuria leucospilota]|uniref:Neuronal acetylcholine receptor subunit beta-3 n=1 Tax=Holothuria leucospilota TaxID=206669 RepID=A0A9Q1BSY2_HOLLE|nr:Neuronal acetylcholine receptor subunit beta-3 [Holothuria leucospilota]
MIDLNEREQIITTASWMTLMWKDERLTWDPEEFGGETSVVVYIDEIWTPKMFIANVLSTDNLILFSAERGLILVTSDGIASLGTPVVQATHCPVDIDYFPYDTQVCPFYIFPENLPVEKMYLYAQPPTRQSSLPSSEWNFTLITSHNHSYVYEDDENNSSFSIATTTFCVFLQRYPNYYVNTLIIPSTVLCLMSFVTFLAPPDSGERISLGVSMVLGLTVFQLLVADILPSASKQNPILGFYLIGTFCLAGLTVPLSLLNIKIAYGDSKIFILKYSCLRKTFLEYLPKICSVPTYSERIKQMITIKPLESNEITRPEGTIAATGEDESNGLARELVKIEEFITNADKVWQNLQN